MCSPLDGKSSGGQNSRPGGGGVRRLVARTPAATEGDADRSGGCVSARWSSWWRRFDLTATGRDESSRQGRRRSKLGSDRQEVELRSARSSDGGARAKAAGDARGLGLGVIYGG